MVDEPTWEVEFTDEFEQWWDSLAASDRLRADRVPADRTLTI